MEVVDATRNYSRGQFSLDIANQEARSSASRS